MSRPAATSEFLPAGPIQRWAAVGLIALEACAMALAWRTFFLPSVCTAAALLGVVGKRHFAWSRDQWAVLVVAIAIFCGLQQYVAPLEVERESLVFPASMALPSTEFILFIQVLALFRRSAEDRLPAFLPGAGAIFLTIVTDVLPSGSAQRTALFALVVAFIVTAVLYLTARSVAARIGARVVRRHQGAARGQVATTVAVATVALLTWISGSLLYGYGRELDTLFSHSWLRRAMAVDLGFSGVSRLGTVARCKTFRSESVALRVVSSDYPGYLRGKAFDEYRNADWMAVGGGRMVTPTEETLPGMSPPLPGEHVFHVQQGRGQGQGQGRGRGRGRPATKCLDVAWSQKDLGEFLFAPLGALGFKTSNVAVSVNRHDVAETVNNLLETPYQVAISGGPLSDSLTPELKARLLAVPRDLDPRIRELASRLFANRATNREKIAAVQDYFRENFQYSLNIDVPIGQDPLAFFLFAKKAADCEYFASAAVMLLRVGGVPCRYVTGFLPSEHNDYNGTWIARNKDAHAWVEAYVEPAGWITVETTPEAGIPQPHEASGLASQLWEAVTSYLRDVTFRTRRLGVLHFLKKALSNRLFMLCLAMVGAWSGIRIARGRRAKCAADSESLRQKELGRILKLLDGRAARQRFVRRASETIDQFADRIEGSLDLGAASGTLARVYRRYSAVRYDREGTGGELAELRVSVEEAAR